MKLTPQEESVVVEVIQRIGGFSNMFLGGSSALKIHGLHLGKPPGDIDLILFSPNSYQIQNLLELAQEFHINVGSSAPVRVDYSSRSHKLVFPNGVIIGILVEETLPVPSKVLFYPLPIYGGLPIQSIDRIFTARRQYMRHGGSKYWQSLMDIVRLNFGLYDHVPEVAPVKPEPEPKPVYRSVYERN